jgi:hypothetical protein
MSAVVNGHKSYNNAINVDGNGNKLTTFAELASRAARPRRGHDRGVRRCHARRWRRRTQCLAHETTPPSRAKC